MRAGLVRGKKVVEKNACEPSGVKGNRRRSSSIGIE